MQPEYYNYGKGWRSGCPAICGGPCNVRETEGASRIPVRTACPPFSYDDAGGGEQVLERKKAAKGLEVVALKRRDTHVMQVPSGKPEGRWPTASTKQPDCRFGTPFRRGCRLPNENSRCLIRPLFQMMLPAKRNQCNSLALGRPRWSRRT